jgi:hypothetical protein
MPIAEALQADLTSLVLDELKARRHAQLLRGGGAVHACKTSRGAKAYARVCVC